MRDQPDNIAARPNQKRHSLIEALWPALGCCGHRQKMDTYLSRLPVESRQPAVSRCRQYPAQHQRSPSLQEINRSAYIGVRARWYDINDARGHLALASKNGHVKILCSDFPTEADAKRARRGRFAWVKRGAASFTLDLATGRPNVFPEIPIKLVGLRLMMATTTISWKRSVSDSNPTSSRHPPSRI